MKELRFNEGNEMNFHKMILPLILLASFLFSTQVYAQTEPAQTVTSKQEWKGPIFANGDFRLEFEVGQVTGQVYLEKGRLMIAVNKSDPVFQEKLRHVSLFAINGNVKTPGKSEWYLWEDYVKAEEPGRGGPQWMYMHTQPTDRDYLPDFLRSLDVMPPGPKAKIQVLFAKEITELKAK